MLDLNFLYKNVNECENVFKYKKNSIYCRINNKGGLNAIYLKKIFSYFKRLIRIKLKSYSLYIYLNGIAFGDESVVVYLELAIFSLIQSGYKKIYLSIDGLDKNNFNYSLYNFSRLNIYKSCKNKVDIQKYIDDFTNKNLLCKENHYNITQSIDHSLTLVAKNDGDIKMSGNTATAVKKYFSRFEYFGKQIKRNIAKLVAEIVDNSMCHTKSDCIISCKVYNVIYDKHEDKTMISIAIANFSDSLLFTELQKKLRMNNLECGAKDTLQQAYKNHRPYFNEMYDEEFFCLVSTFQKKVTTRSDAECHSGRGLTRFLSYIVEFAELEECYVYSSDRLLWLKKEYLKADTNGFVGFNDSNDYINLIPNDNNFAKLEYHNNGTLFNLKMIFDRSDLSD